MNFTIFRILWLAAVLGLSCACSKQSNFGVETWSGKFLDGKPITFSDLKSKMVILNVYSPTCQPCIEELPALKILYEKARQKDYPLYIVVDSRVELHGLERIPGREDFSVLKNRLMEDIQRYSINIPVVIMDDSFQVSREDGLVTGTPETLFFKTEPFYLLYNFIGSISMTEDAEKLQNDSRFRFVLNKI